MTTQKRLNIILPPMTEARIQHIRELTECSTATEVIKNAIQIYDFVATSLNNGDQMYMKSADGEITNILPILPTK